MWIATESEDPLRDLLALRLDVALRWKTLVVDLPFPSGESLPVLGQRRARIVWQGDMYQRAKEMVASVKHRMIFIERVGGLRKRVRCFGSRASVKRQLRCRKAKE